MELLQLRYFHALAATESMSATAKALFISVPSLSLTISRLEKELGVPLFGSTTAAACSTNMWAGC